jgi:subtilase family serine protease
VDFDLVLHLRDVAGAQALVRAVSSPGSASYRHYLTAAQWESRFSPSAGEVNAARSWLESQGFQVQAVSADRMTISASGTAAQVERAFTTNLGQYRLNGKVVRLASSPLSVPASLAGSVVGALGVNQNVATPAIASDGSITGSSSTVATGSGGFPPAPGAFVTSPPCGTYYGQTTTIVEPFYGHGYPTIVPDQVCGYKGSQWRSAYNVPSGATGKGITVAIIDAYGSATINSDATQYFKTQDSTNPFANANFSQQLAMPFTDGSICAPSSWLVEQALDVEAVHSISPNANILYVGAKNCINGLFRAEQKVIDGGLANVVTNSWGDTGGDLLDDISTRNAYDGLFMLAASTGMTVQFSTGDEGDNFGLLGVSSADYPASSPFVTAVGGTTLQVGSRGQLTGQLGWATGRSWKCTANLVNILCSAAQIGTWLPASYDGGSGGFTSYIYNQPWYQAPVVPSSLATRNSPIVGSTPKRVIPDLSMDADPATGLLMGLHQTFPDGSAKYSLTRYGGTSLASPLLAGLVADTDSAAIADGGTVLGFINPAIYRLHNTLGAIADVTPGGKQAQYRTDHAYTYLGPGAPGLIFSFREITYEGTIVYCDATGNCASRPNTLSTATGYDSMTGLGSTGPDFVSDLSQF